MLAGLLGHIAAITPASLEDLHDFGLSLIDKSVHLLLQLALVYVVVVALCGEVALFEYLHAFLLSKRVL